jgi:hypothetical protein
MIFSLLKHKTMKTKIGDIVANDKATKDSPNYLGVITSIEKWSKGLVYKVEFRDLST